MFHYEVLARGQKSIYPITSGKLHWSCMLIQLQIGKRKYWQQKYLLQCEWFFLKFVKVSNKDNTLYHWIFINCFKKVMVIVWFNLIQLVLTVLNTKPFLYFINLSEGWDKGGEAFEQIWGDSCCYCKPACMALVPCFLEKKETESLDQGHNGSKGLCEPRLMKCLAYLWPIVKH